MNSFQKSLVMLALILCSNNTLPYNNYGRYNNGYYGGGIGVGFYGGPVVPAYGVGFGYSPYYYQPGPADVAVGMMAGAMTAAAINSSSRNNDNDNYDPKEARRKEIRLQISQANNRLMDLKPGSAEAMQLDKTIAQLNKELRSV